MTDLLKCHLNSFDCAFVLFLGNFRVQKDFYFPSSFAKNFFETSL